jgi:hypothetical protein
MTNADLLAETIIALIVENATLRAALSPVLHDPFIEVDQLPGEFDQALQEINDRRRGAGLKPCATDSGFKQAVIDRFLQRMEKQARVMVGH